MTSDRDIARLQAGDPKAFDELYHTYFDSLSRYVGSMLTPSDVEDVVQTVFINALQAVHRFEYRSPASMRAWLFTIARNVVLDYRRAREPAQPVAPAELADSLHEREVRAPGSMHETHNLGWLSDARLLAALRGLSEFQREVIVLRYAGDLTLSEVASVLAVTESAVKQAHRRALEALSRRLTTLETRSTRRRRPLSMGQLSPGGRSVWSHSFSPRLL